MIVEFVDFLRSRMAGLAKIGVGILVLLVCLDALVINKHHAHTAIERFPAFWSIFGFVVAAIIIIVAKWFGRQGIRQKEDYYD